MKSFTVLLIVVFMLFGIFLGAAFTAIYMTEMLDKFPTLVVGVLAACFAFLGVVLSQAWQSKNIDKTIKSQSENINNQLNSQRIVLDHQLAHAEKLHNDKAERDKLLKHQEIMRDKTEEFCLMLYLWRKQIHYIIDESFRYVIFYSKCEAGFERLSVEKYDEKIEKFQSNILKLENELNELDSKVVIYQELYDIADVQLCGDMLNSVKKYWPMDLEFLMTQSPQILIEQRHQVLNDFIEVGIKMNDVINRINVSLK